jgi:hypothetical protein
MGAVWVEVHILVLSATTPTKRALITFFHTILLLSLLYVLEIAWIQIYFSPLPG